MVTTTGCDVCNKSSLSLLLLRPSPIANSPLLAAAGARGVAADPAVLTGMLPSPAPKQSRFALRLLRAGYVHIFLPSPPAGVPSWLVYRVTEQADLVPEGSELFAQADASVSCSRSGHIAMGLKVVSIPQAHKVTELWVAYSANLWNDTLRGKNKADPAVMQKISLQSCGVNSFVPTADKLKAQVLECALNKLSIDGASDHDFPFNSIASSAEDLAANLKLAAAKHPKTAGKEIAVVLRDPVGIATELNALRVRRNELLKKEIAKPENLHPLNSSATVLGLKQSLVREEDLSSFEQVSPLRTLSAYMQDDWPAGTEWQAVTDEDRKMLLSRVKGDGAFSEFVLSPYKAVFEKKNLGRVFYPDHDKRAAEWTKKKVEENWSKLAKYHDEEARAAWIKNFDAKMKTLHYDPLALFEEDWHAATEDKQTLAYFARHFDPLAKADPLKQPASGVLYARENHLINQPAPFSEGLLTRYLAKLGRPITDEEAVVLRALVGNQDAMIKMVHIQLTGDPGAAGMRDKSYDLVKGFSELGMSKGALTANSWIGHAIALFSVGQLSALSGAALTVAAREAKTSSVTASIMAKLQMMAHVQRCLEYSVQGALHGNAPNVPVLLKMQVSADDALKIFAARSGQPMGTSKTRIKKAKANNAKVTLTLATDTDAIKAANGNVGDIAQNPASGSVKMGKAATSAAIGAAGSTAVLTEEKFLQLYQSQAGTGAKAANMLRSALPNLAKTSGGAWLMAMAKTLDARLALGSMIIQAIGVWNGMDAASQAKSESSLTDANYGVLDSVLGFTGGALALWSVGAELRVVARLGHQAVGAHIGIGLLKIGGSITGIAGGAVNYVASQKKSDDQRALGNKDAARLYNYSAIAFLATGATSTLLTGGAIAGALEARAIGGAVVRTVATRLAANAVFATVGGIGLTVSGIGLLLLGAGVVAQIGAIVLTPTDMQRWLGRSYFGRDGGLIFSGKRDDMFKKGDWAAEKEALDEIIADAAKQQSENKDTKKVEQSA
ncbi:T6SS effector BTH_I2691 family protein [Duganella sp. HH101]|uniref:T6SS effector BTH_I2691 family protein n=1 Tax=Duganella sp. HH101 TaxID=1781066 RepID=UPI000873A232|nr:T6SS effector BTH_I2691 family protein [Duganella sp. HH101]OFA05505.1 hypothetical protein DUGA2_10830 [Duganella sp. HH101]